MPKLKNCAKRIFANLLADRDCKIKVEQNQRKVTYSLKTKHWFF